MTTINKIYLQVLVQLLQGEKLVCSFNWIFQPALSALCNIRYFSPEVRQNLASKHQLCNNKTNYAINSAASERMAISINY
jgi:hypothetical protein